ncbi:MAG: hypothetical protein ACP5OG_02975 [Candidatus Nanoarchaeia archaeon]
MTQQDVKLVEKEFEHPGFYTNEMNKTISFLEQINLKDIVLQHLDEILLYSQDYTRNDMQKSFHFLCKLAFAIDLDVEKKAEKINYLLYPEFKANLTPGQTIAIAA